MAGLNVRHLYAKKSKRFEVSSFFCGKNVQAGPPGNLMDL